MNSAVPTILSSACEYNLKSKEAICMKSVLLLPLQLAPDKQGTLTFAGFDENRSWYVDENIQKHQNSSKSTDPEVYNSNVIYSEYTLHLISTMLWQTKTKQTKIHVFHLHLPGINGIMFGGTLLSTCQTDVTFWHVANVGTQSNFLSAYFTGNAFQYNGLRQSVLTLFPMTSMTVIMEMDLPGNHIQPLESTLVTFAQWKLHGSLVKNII